VGEPAAIPVALQPPYRGRARLTLLDRYLLRVVGSRAVMCLGMIFAVMMLERTLRLATQMAASGAHLSYLWPMIGNLAPHYVGLALTPALMLAMLLAVGRLDGDYEIEAMLASGFSLRRVLAALVAVSLAAGLIELAVVGWLEPHGRFGFRAARDAATEAGWTAELQPLAFQTRAGGVTATADTAVGGGRRLGHVFIDRPGPKGLEVVITAPSGLLSLAPDGHTAQLNLGAGQVYVERPPRPPMEGRFVAYALKDPYAQDLTTPPRGQDPEELTLSELAGRLGGRPAAAVPRALDSRAVKAEFNARLARLAAFPLLPLIALPLGLTSGRGRRSASLALAGITVLVFHQSLRLAQSLSVINHAEPALALWSVFAALAGLALWIFLSSHRLLGDTPVSVVVQHVHELIERRPRSWSHGGRGRKGSVAGYVGRCLAVSTLAAWAGLIGLLATIDLFEKTDDILARGLGAAGVVHYALDRLPVIAEQTAALAVLAGAVTTFSQMGRRGELVALRALGISVFQILRMALPVGLAMALVVVTLAEWISPRAQLDQAAWWAATAPPAPGARQTPTRTWLRVGDEIVSAERVSADGARLDGLIVYRRDSQGLLASRLAATQAQATGEGWRLHQVRLSQPDDAGVTVRAQGDRVWKTGLKPPDLVTLAARPLQISAASALAMLQGRAGGDQSRGYMVTRLHRALAEPLAPFMMLLLAAPLAMARARNGAPGRLLAYALGGGLLYVVADGVFTAAGQTGLATPWVAAWLVPALFGCLAGAVLVFSED
jgi:lipopolysaccharide export system permease protein